MTLELGDCTFAGPAMPQPFVKYRLEELLTKKKLLAKATGDAGKKLQESWQIFRKKLRALGEQGLEQRVLHHVLEPLVERLGWQLLEKADPVTTREGREEGGYLLRIAPAEGEREDPHIRAWVYPVGTDLDAPNKRGRAYRFSPGLVAQRVLLAKGERVGLLTDGLELRILLSDPSGRDSHIRIQLDRSGGWRASRDLPDSFRLVKALCQPSAAGAIGDLLNEARLSQSSVTKKLREQARHAVERFIQALLDDPANGELHSRWSDDDEAAQEPWREGLVLVYRLLFILKLETSPDPARAFTFASSSLWRNSYSPSTTLAPVVEKVRDHGADTGEFLGHSLRALFRLFSHGLSTNELHVSPLGGMLFGKEATPILNSLHWSEQAVAHLLDALLWTPADKKLARGAEAGRERIHYGSLDVEDLGRVYEALLELEPGIATKPMCRLRRAKLEVVVPVAQGASYRTDRSGDEADDEDSEDEEDDQEKAGKGKTTVLFIEEIPEGHFYLRVGLGRKASGSYYTPHPFVRFLVQETLGPQVIERSPQDDPNPLAILGLKVLDPAMGSGHFLVEACRFLGDALYEACRLCDERALEAQKKAPSAKHEGEKEKLLGRARDLWKRVEDLPDPNDELVAYLPSHVLEGEESGLSQRKALALCRRLVAVHCLYGIDKNPLAVELARVSLWLESYAEGLPLTFLEHRLICGDSLTGPFFEHLLTYPGTGERINNLFARGVTEKLTKILAEALVHVRDLEATIGKDAADIELKKIAKAKLDAALSPLKVLAAAWAGGVLLGVEECDDAGYENMLRAIAERQDTNGPKSSRSAVSRMIQRGVEGVPFDLTFPEVYFRTGKPIRTGGFDAVLGNPPWDRINVSEVDYWSQVDIRVLDAPTLAHREAIQKSIKDERRVAEWSAIEQRYAEELRLRTRLFTHQTADADGEATRGSPDSWRLFAERFALLSANSGRVGFVVPSSFHANEGALAIRAFYFDRVGLRSCFSFENRGRRFFDIHASFKFDVVVAGGGVSPAGRFTARFYLHEDSWLFGDGREAEALTFSRDIVARTGGVHRTLAELTSAADLEVLVAMTGTGTTFGDLRKRGGLDIRQEINITRGASAFLNRADVAGADDPRDWACLCALIAKGIFTVDDDKTFHQYTDRWERWLPRYLTSAERLSARADLLEAVRHYRIAVRKTTGGRNERTGIFALLPPGHIATDKSPCERFPSRRPTARALEFLGLVNSFPADWLFRLRVQTDMNMFMLDVAPAPSSLPALIAHGALRLSANHRGYEFLWREHFGAAWREQRRPFTWPVLETDEERLAVRASMDAVVAEAYGLSGEQYSHVLSSFSHKTYPTAPRHCLDAFDELRGIGREAFVKKHDPYWDIALVTTLPKPVFNLQSNDTPSTSRTFHLKLAKAKPKRGRAKKGASA